MFILSQWIFGIIIFFTGLAVGSFLNVIVLRNPLRKGAQGGTPWKGRSSCVSCEKTLAWYDLAPLVSFLYLKGRCRYCGAKISLQYPLVEIVTGGIFLLLFLKLSHSLADFFSWLILCSLFLLVAIFDILYKRIPVNLLLIILCAGLFFVGLPFLSTKLFSFNFFWQLPQEIPTLFFSGFINGAFILFLVVVTKERGMGMGDVPIAFLQGLLLGYPKGFVALFLSFIIGSVFGVSLIVLGKAGLKSQVPFAPFLIISLFIVKFFSIPSLIHNSLFIIQ